MVVAVMQIINVVNGDFVNLTLGIITLVFLKRPRGETVLPPAGGRVATAEVIPMPIIGARPSCGGQLRVADDLLGQAGLAARAQGHLRRRPPRAWPCRRL